MDVIIKSYLDKFIKDFELEESENKISDNFEAFVGYVIVSNTLQNTNIDSNDIENISIDKNKGIDSIAFIINNKLVTNVDELNDLFSENKTASVEICFIQTKTSEHFDDSEISTFADTIIDFTKPNPTYPLTKEAQNYHEMLMTLYGKMPYIHKFVANAYYVCAGNWNGDELIENTCNIKETLINNLNIFKNGFKIVLQGANNIIKIYDKITSPLNVEVKIKNVIALDNPPEGIKQAYVGLISFSEFKKIIIDKETGRIRSLFYDNLRDDLGIDNPVNEKISKTLVDKKYALFPLLNNGITIIAEKNSGYADNYVLENFQIVNGCQTSNVICSHMDDSGIDDLIIPLKLIITEDSDIRDEIIIATNSQTAINNEQMLALTQFQKDLEKFYLTQPDGLYYERRINQYKNSSVKQKNIITLREQIKTFAAVCKNVPHIVSGYFGKIYKKYENSIFLSRHNFQAYYFAALIQYKFKELINKKLIDRKYNKLRYHIFMLYRMFFEKEDFTEETLNKKKKKYFEDLINTLREDDEKLLLRFNKIINLINNTTIDISNQKEIYKVTTTEILLNKFEEVGNNDGI